MQNDNNALARAKHCMESAEKISDDVVARDWISQAHAYAAIAQAEQLKRIADALYTPDYDGNITGVAKILEELNQNINRAAIY